MTAATRDLERTPARLYAGVFGAVLVLAGILGFFYESSFSDDPAVRDAVLGLLDVNGFHNVVHIATGLLGLWAYAAGNAASRTYALGLGLVYLVVAIWGFALESGESILDIVPINTEDNVLHVVIALTGLAAYAASPANTTSTRRTSASAA